jgi:pimeloyl-ACP methyl ester carboxylesterase
MIEEVDGITWYYERYGQGPTVVLIPSGEGDCGSFATTANELARDFTVLTFDMPGFSRSSDPPDFDHYSTAQAASEVGALVRSLGLAPATFYGCSSGGQVALSIAVDHPDLVRYVAVHEVPLSPHRAVQQLQELPDEQLIGVCRDLFRNQLNEKPEAWDALGAEFHRRLDRNYVTWTRKYVSNGQVLRTFTADDLRGRPITWTIGGLTPAFAFLDNAVLACAAGVPIGILMCKHFPQVSIPEVLADHIRKLAHA